MSRKKNKLHCPGHYGKYGTRGDICPECGQPRLYAICRFYPPVPETIGKSKIPIIHSHPACDGWYHKKSGSPYCCKHYLINMLISLLEKTRAEYIRNPFF